MQQRQMAPSSEQSRLLAELIESLTQAAGAASQLIHHMQHPGFIVVREAIDLTKEGVAKIATFQAASVLVGAPK